MPGKSRGRKDSVSDAGSAVPETVGTFETLRDEGEHFVHVKQYKRAIDSFTKALEMKEGDCTCLVIRAKCHLMLGNAESALTDADAALQSEDEQGAKDIRALLMKAESLYQKGDFETALVYYHRGNKQRPELQDFRLGIQKSQEAINNSIGEPNSVKLETTGDLSFFHKQEESSIVELYRQKQKQQQRSGYYKPQQQKEEKKERNRPKTASDPKTTKQLLGQLFQDKVFLESLFDEMTSNPTDTGEFVKGRACDGLEYLHSRSDFWRQQKPMYARKRDRQRQDEKLSRHKSANSGKSESPVQYILRMLEEIDEALSKEKYDESLQKCKKTLKKIDGWSDDEVKNKPEYIANVHSCMGNAYLELNKLELSLENHQKDKEIGEEHDLEDAVSRALDNIGRVYARKGDYEKAIDVWTEKMPMSKTPLESTWINHEIGRCYFELKKHSDAKEYGEKSLSAAKEADDEGWQLHACVLIAQSQVKCGELQSGVDSFERALEMAKSQKDKSAEKAIKKALEDINDQIVRNVEDSDSPRGSRRGSSEEDKPRRSSSRSSSASSSKSNKSSSDKKAKEVTTNKAVKTKKKEIVEPEKKEIVEPEKKCPCV